MTLFASAFINTQTELHIPRLTEFQSQGLAQQPPCGPVTPYYPGFTITLTGHTTVDRIPLDEWSARRSDVYRTPQNTHNHVPVGTRSRNPRKWATADPRLKTARPAGGARFLIYLCVLDRASSWYLNKGRPTWLHLLYYVNLLLCMFRMLIHPSSGACDCLVRYCVGCIVL